MQLSLEQLNVFLNTAVRENQIENAKYYLEKGAGLILEGQKNPLDFAAFTGNVPMIELLLDHGVSHVTRNKDGKAPIQMVADQDWASYNAFGLRRADIDPATGISGNFCVGLISAIQHDNLEVAEAFLKAGVATDGTYRIDSKTTTSYQLAHLAAHKGNKEMIRLLLEYGASFETVEKKNGALKPAQILVKKGYWDCVNLLTEKLTEQVPDQYCFGHALILAVDQNKIEEAKCLLKAKARTGWHFTNNNNRPLHIAALAGNSLLIGWLLHHDAKNTDKNKEGKTPIELVRKDDWESYLTFGLYNRDYEAAARYHVGLLNAVRHNQLKVARVLLTANADTRVEFTKGQAKYNLVHVAAKKGNLGMIALLLEYNVDFSAIATKKNVPCKPLKILEKKQHWHCVKWIADHQKEINKDEFSYGSALIEVVKKGWVDVAESLLKAGASTDWHFPETKNRALHFAVTNNHLRMLALLLKYNVQDVRNDQNKLASDLASERSLFPLMNSFVEPQKVGVGLVDDTLVLGRLFRGLDDKESIISHLPAEILELIIAFAFNDLLSLRTDKILNKISLELYFNSIRTICEQYCRYKKCQLSDLRNLPISNLEASLIVKLHNTIISRVPSVEKNEQCESYIKDYLKATTLEEKSKEEEKQLEIISSYIPLPAKLSEQFGINKFVSEVIPTSKSKLSFLNIFSRNSKDEYWCKGAIERYHLTPSSN